MQAQSINSSQDEGRPYRSHLHPACFSCRKRKSRCKTKSPAEVCVMCQAYGTECIFPRPGEPPQQRGWPRNGAPNARSSRHMHSRKTVLHHQPYSNPRTQSAADSSANRRTQYAGGDAYPAGGRGEALPHLMGIATEAEEDSSHIVSPAVADDNDILESYLSAIPTARRRQIINTGSSNRHFGPVRFNAVPRRPLGVVANQSFAASKCELIEKYMDPDIDEYLNLFFIKANPCFPLFDEYSFRGSYTTHKEKISPALLCNLYANSLVYWKSSAKLSSSRTPDIRYIWNQANEALHSELFLSPGISSIMAILLNVCGRPSTSMFGNGGMLGMAVALSNALGLNRDPSSWSISALEKSLRIRIWWLVLIHDRWCSLAYGTPLQVHRAQYDVPSPSVDDVCSNSAPSSERAAAAVFVALATLTDVLARYLEHVYSVSRDFLQSKDMTEMDLEHILRDWEESLSDEVRHLVLRGINLDIPGAANFRLAYLAVKLLLRRLQLNMSKSSLQVEDDVASPFYMHAQRAAEEIAYLVQELDEVQFRGFWIPVHAFSLTSATMFLLRSGLRMGTEGRNTPLKTARDMINALQAHRRDFDWDLADNCLTNCGELLDRIGMVENTQNGTAMVAPDFPDIPDDLEIDPSILEELFGAGLEGVDICSPAFNDHPFPTIPVECTELGPSGTYIDNDHTSEGAGLIPALAWPSPTDDTNRQDTVYVPPTPFFGDGPHRYFFELIALNDSIDTDRMSNPATVAEVRREITGKVAGWGEWVGVFEYR
ncbi:transcription factor domain-containing protein [Aspergillus undulatus]|uniref:transcription factor domain-containing protein n=1 Tax=Aspergillus undulatus TaxID=1810928 RepID=UPI003CCD4180